MRRSAVLAVLSLAGTMAFAQPKQIKPKSKGEATAINAMLTAPDPDSRIKAADDLITKFADTEAKPTALYIEAESYQMKGDNDKAIVFGEQALRPIPKATSPRFCWPKPMPALRTITISIRPKSWVRSTSTVIWRSIFWPRPPSRTPVSAIPTGRKSRTT